MKDDTLSGIAQSSDDSVFCPHRMSSLPACPPCRVGIMTHLLRVNLEWNLPIGKSPGSLLVFHDNSNRCLWYILITGLLTNLGTVCYILVLAQERPKITEIWIVNGLCLYLKRRCDQKVKILLLQAALNSRLQSITSDLNFLFRNTHHRWLWCSYYSAGNRLSF